VAVISAQALSKQFLLRHNASVELKVRFLGLLDPRRRESIEQFWALRNVSLAIRRGEAVGLVGRNGSGKSTLLKLIAGIHRPTSGILRVARGARISSMIELGVGFHPELTGRENVFLNASIHGLSRAQIEDIYAKVVEYSGLAHFIDVPIKNYSSGMHMRLGFAIAANLDPDILLLDEIFAVGDADFQQRCVGTVRRFLDDGKTLIFVSHAPSAIREICRRVCVLDAGHLRFDGGLDEGLSFYDRQLSGTEERGDEHSGSSDHATDAGEQTAPATGPDGASGHEWSLVVLREHGLRPDHPVLEVRAEGPTSSPSFRWLSVEGHGTPQGASDADIADGRADFAVATSLFSEQPLNVTIRALFEVRRKLSPSGLVLVAWFENQSSEAVRRGDVVTFLDREPYHYDFDLVSQVCAMVGFRVERLGGQTSPSGESVFVLTPL
jgi:ABC-2 type transport system ATP-binding protein/lipopolysaccharide transport system ATP-binding protein